ncbi:Alpha/beta hydrolase family protein [Nocardioides dokdonensis FR1436]|uniref:Alpha/beta hydrolase family protein n=1 Tax=Nocardioides dokdonensis FR1436 TaxID=1300347 RepID=A0A1A9GH05_9ACTN|nr:alpha/beta hydrolase [Nocardioides dokdonensis]ANH37336.1 Alpha/beta hydrolase family protein [Nocardioides dokdonensis FR1436]
MHRRNLLVLPALAAVAVAAAACATGPEEVPPVPDDATTEELGYGEDPSQYAVLTRPAAAPRGVAVVVHGGFWKAEYGIEYAEPLVPSLVEAGWAVLALEYRRVGTGAGAGGGVPETLDDVAAGIDLLADLELGVDLAAVPVVAIGHSAGGHLATWAASRTRHDRWAGGVGLTHVVSQAGVLDLVAADAAGLGGGAVAAFLGRAPGPQDASVDPLRQVPLDQPVWCVHGRDDTVVPPSQSQTYVDTARAAGASAELVEVEGDHFTVVDPASPAWGRTLEILADL